MYDPVLYDTVFYSRYHSRLRIIHNSMRVHVVLLGNMEPVQHKFRDWFGYRSLIVSVCIVRNLVIVHIMDNSITRHIDEVNLNTPDFRWENCISVSKCIGFMKHEFNAEVTAKNMIPKHFNNPSSKYYQMTAEQIIEMWNEKAESAKEKGRQFDALMNQLIEVRDNNELQLWKYDVSWDENDFLKRAYEGFKKLLEILQAEYMVIGTELPLYARSCKNPNHITCGRCDCLLWNWKTKRYLIIDWKTSEQIKQSAFKNMKGPGNKYPDADYFHYMTQLSFYKKSIVETYKLASAKNVDILICQMGIPENPGFKTFGPTGKFMYDSAYLDNAIDYAFLRKEIEIEHQAK